MRKKLGLALVLLGLLVAAGVIAFQASRSRTWQAFGEIVPRVETDEPIVALTFDDGPTDATDEVLAHLAAANAKATFFLTGREMADRPDLAAKIAGAGHEIGNHSWSHQRMVLKSPAWMRDELDRTDERIRAAGYAGPIAVRAPFCKKGLALPWIFARTGRVHVTFDVEPDSYADVAASAEGIASHVRERVRPGSIILLHVMYPSRRTSMDAVPIVLGDLREAGLRPVTVSELLRSRSEASTAR
jgi:peptidoglycan/xylan/chitin deacetylase (PgdA/CDA1 family)